MFGKNLKLPKSENENKKKIENIVFLIVVLIITILIINSILKTSSNTSKKSENIVDSSKVFADSNIQNNVKNTETDGNLEKNLENILKTIKGVGDVKVFVNYSESNKVVAMYDETSTTNSIEETDTSGGKRDTTSTQKQKQVVYSDDNGKKSPVTEKVVMPKIEGAIITATGANDMNVKTNIINAVQAATGLGIDKIQVFELEK